MGLETGTGIGDLVPTNPLSTDAVSSGDDHIRLIKTVMQSITFLKSIQTFTASGTWTRPANVKHVLVYCLGGGAGGSGGSVAGFSGGGGGGAATAIKWLDVTAISSVTVTIGAGGAGGTSPGGLGVIGADTSFGVHCVAKQGLAAGASEVGGVAHPASSSVGDITFAGCPGQGGTYTPAVTAFGGQGGGTGGTTGTNAPVNGGGGGGGGSASSSLGGAGSNGGSGYCIVFEFGW